MKVLNQGVIAYLEDLLGIFDLLELHKERFITSIVIEAFTAPTLGVKIAPNVYSYGKHLAIGAFLDECFQDEIKLEEFKAYYLPVMLGKEYADSYQNLKKDNPLLYKKLEMFKAFCNSWKYAKTNPKKK